MGNVSDALGIEKTIIMEKEYAIAPLPAGDGLAVAMELTKLLAPVFGEGVDGWVKERNYVDDPKTFSGAAKALITQIGEVDVLGLIKKLLEGLSVDGSPVNFDRHFRANYGELVQVTEWVLRINFSSFFMDAGLNSKLVSFITSLVATEETPEQ